MSHFYSCVPRWVFLLWLSLLVTAFYAQAQSYTSRYFHYDQYYDAPAPFTIMANTSDGADTNQIVIAGGGSSATTRGGAILISGNENSGAGGVGLYSGGTGAVSMNPSGYVGWYFTSASDAASDFIFGRSTVASSVATIRGARADGSDDGILILTGGGASGVTRGATATLYGDDNSGSMYLYSSSRSGAEVRVAAASTNGQVAFYGNGQQKWFVSAASGDLVQDATNGGNIVMAKAGSSISVNGIIKSTANTLAWVIRTGANTACTTTCGAGKGCVMGQNTAALGYNLVDCADATADVCVCTF